MEIRSILFLVMSVLIIILSTGCVSQSDTQKDAIPPPSENKSSTLSPSEMALQLSDFPEGFRPEYSRDIDFKQDKNYNHLNPKKGYAILVGKNSTPYDFVFIYQTILIVPEDKISHIIPDERSFHEKIGPQSELLPDPHIGDSSFASRFAGDRETTEIIFIKKDVAEYVGMQGPQTDYELLKTLTKKAADKIK
jgi:hypothetical protein